MLCYHSPMELNITPEVAREIERQMQSERGRKGAAKFVAGLDPAKRIAIGKRLAEARRNKAETKTANAS